MKTALLVVISAILVGCQVSPPATTTAPTTQWKTYTNSRFGFRLNYPGTLVGGRDPDNGAGKSFTSADGEFEVHVQGHFIAKGQSLGSYYAESLSERKGTVTYKKKGSSWYVISGTNERGFEYYEKFFVKDGNWVELHMAYPHSKANVYDSWVEAIEDSFVPFLEGDFDRVAGD